MPQSIYTCQHCEVRNGHCLYCGLDVNDPPRIYYTYSRLRWYTSWHYVSGLSFRYATHRDPRLGLTPAYWPLSRKLLWPICLILGHTGWGTFGYFSCARCKGDW